MSNNLVAIAEMIRPTVEALGVTLWGVDQVGQGRNSILRVYIDKPDDGITIDDCERVSRQISGIFDVEDPIAGEYVLEVSSPGMDRPFFEHAHFARFTGSVANVRLRTPVDGRRRFKGVIQKVEADQICLVVDEKEISFPFSAVDKANLVY